ncbi:MAG: zinc metallopeptidase [Eubacteriales bacterium]|nr:zinc metallopeptidase [Eubacteriales bacterium]
MSYSIFAYYYFPFDKWYFLLVLPSFLLALYAQFKVKSSFSKYSQIASSRGITGAQLAHEILQAAGLLNVGVERVRGNLTDHYSPREEVLRLSDPVYNSSSIAALGVAAHESGHALQYGDAYFPIKLRSAIYPLASIGSAAGPYMAVFGLVMQLDLLFNIGILFYAVAVLFYLFTLPVEFNASRRALEVLETGNYLNSEELKGARSVLRAAAMTYIASATTAFVSLLRLILIRNEQRR